MGRSVPRRAKRLSCLSPPRGFRLPRPGCSRRLHCEALEDRRLLTITVDTLLDELDGSIVDGDISLRDAIAAATPDETIDFHLSLDGRTILLTLGELAINKPLTIDGTALAGGLTIDASGNDPTPDTDNGNGSRIFYIDDGDSGTDSPVAIGGLTLTGGDVSGRGGAIFARETLTVTSSTISGNSAGRRGGGIHSYGNVMVTSSTITGNSARGGPTYGGGGIYARGDVTVTSSTISGNSAASGGGIYARGDVTVTSSTISGNSASAASGGGIWASGSVAVTSSMISGNSAEDDGGGIWARRDAMVISSTISGNSADVHGGGIFASNVTVTYSTVSGNSADRGGGISASNVTVTYSTISGNSADSGGGIRASGSVAVTYSTISGNSADSGGGILAFGDATVTNSTISDNSADSGGGIRAFGDVTVTYSTISGNLASGIAGMGDVRGGGAIWADGSVTVTSSTISGNEANWRGGGIYASGSVTVTNSTISGNSAEDDGGGICSYGNVMVTSSTISGNSADRGGGIRGRRDVMVTASAIAANSAHGEGGAIYSSFGHVTVVSSTIAGNSAGLGSGTFGGGFVMLTVCNSIITRDEATGDEDIASSLTSESGFNLIDIDAHFVRNPSSGADGAWGTPDDDYGDLRLTDDSPAIDMGSNSLVPPDLVTDLDGNPRIYGPRVDVGAYEFQGAPAAGRDTPSTLVTTAGDVFDLYDGEVSLREAIWYAADGERVTFSTVLDQGEIVLSGTSVVLDRSVTIDASTLESLTINADGKSRVFTALANEVELSGLTITSGAADSGGGIYARGDVTVTSSTIEGNSASAASGGGIWAAGSVTVTSSTISGNSAARDGGGIWTDGNVTVTSSTIAGNWAGRYGGGIRADGNVTVTSSTIAGNSADRGGGIFARLSDVTVTSSTISGNSAEDGGGIFSRGNVTVTSSRLAANSARGENGSSGYECGGGIWASGDVTVTSSTISGNSAARDGGGIYAGGDVTVTSSTIAGNSARDSGGGISNSGMLTLCNSIVALNEAARDEDPWIGGSLTAENGFNLIGVDPHFVRNPSSGADGTWGTADDDSGDLRLTDHSPAIDMGSNSLVPPDLVTDLDGNPRIYGPGVDVGAYEFQGAPAAGRETPSTLVTTAGDVFDLYDGEISLREAVWYAAAGERVTFAATLDHGEIVLSGTSVLLDRSVTINASTLESLTINADWKSRAFTALANEVELLGLTITGGVAYSGGGIWASGDVTVTSSTISGNSAGSRGGGIYARGDVTVTSSTISGNSAEDNGGGIYADGDVTVTSSTISGNSAEDDGGGIYAGGDVTVINSTIAGNSADRGGGIWASGDVTITIENSIIADRIRRRTGALTVRYSLISDNSSTGLAEAPIGMPDENGNLIGGPIGGIIDPMLGPLADHGGPTETHGLLSGSPAIDAGDPDLAPPPDFDQRGWPRVVDGNADGLPRIDMGALELPSGGFYLVPLRDAGPLGSLVYRTSAGGIIDSAADEDIFSIDLDDGQTVTVVVEPEAGLQAEVALLDPGATSLASAAAARAGAQVVLQTVPTSGPGLYEVVVRGAGGTTGRYKLQLILNGAVEQEQYGGAPNDGLLTAQDIDASFLSLRAGRAERGAVLGSLASFVVANMGSELNAAGNDSEATLSADGLTVVFASDRPGGAGGTDLYMATRASTLDPFAAVVTLGLGVNTAANETGPALSADGLTLYFGSGRAGGFGSNDLYMATRASASDPFGNVTNLGAGVNTAASENNPAVSADGLTLAFNSYRPGELGGQDIYLATRAATSDAFDGVTRLGQETNFRFDDAGPSLSADGLALYFYSDRPGLGGTDLYVARRSDPSGSFGYAVNLGPDINGPGNDRSPSLSFDGETLLFNSDRPGGEGGQDLYAWTRTGADWYQFTLDAGASTSVVLSSFDTSTGHQAFTFAQNRDGYAGTVDTYLKEDSPDSSYAGSQSLNVDASTPGVVQALVRFDEIFGSGFDQIASGDKIVSARLELEVHDPGDRMRLHRMLQDWVDTDTWNHFGGNGIQADDVEAASIPDATTAAGITGSLSIDVTASLRAWQQDPTTNLGWALLPTDDDGVDFYSSDGSIAPRLVVEVAGSLAQLELYDAAGQLLGSGAADAVNVSQAVHDFVAPETGTYFARVAGRARGDYRMVVTRNATFDTEPNDDRLAEAQDISLSRSVLGHVSSDDGPIRDNDFYSIEVAQGDTLIIELALPAGGPFEFVNELDALIELYDPSGTRVASESGGPLTHMAMSTGPYTVGLLADSGTKGEYLLSVAVAPKGDMNLDGSVNMGDIDGFVLALASPAQYEASYGVDPALNGDMDGDGDLDFDDIDDFVGVISSGSPASDLNADSRVNGLDVEPFVDVLIRGSFHAGADVNRDGAVNGLDVGPFVQAVLTGSAQASVPADNLEQSDIALAVASILRKLDRLGYVHPDSLRGYGLSARSGDLREERGLRQLHHTQDACSTDEGALAKRSPIGARFGRDGRRSPREEMQHGPTGDWQAAVDRALAEDADWIGQSGH